MFRPKFLTVIPKYRAASTPRTIKKVARNLRRDRVSETVTRRTAQSSSCRVEWYSRKSSNLQGYTGAYFFRICRVGENSCGSGRNLVEIRILAPDVALAPEREKFGFDSCAPGAQSINTCPTCFDTKRSNSHLTMKCSAP
jgi:hypothetical protein